MNEKKATYIQIDYDDGSQDIATGEAAERILEWYRSCETMNWIHGARYDGPQYTHIPAGTFPMAAD